jgi:hypothetical protein
VPTEAALQSAGVAAVLTRVIAGLRTLRIDVFRIGVAAGKPHASGVMQSIMVNCVRRLVGDVGSATARRILVGAFWLALACVSLSCQLRGGLWRPGACAPQTAFSLSLAGRTIPGARGLVRAPAVDLGAAQRARHLAGGILARQPEHATGRAGADWRHRGGGARAELRDHRHGAELWLGLERRVCRGEYQTQARCL